MDELRQELEELKYRQLQKRAKEFSIKANLPRQQLIDEILDKEEAKRSDEVGNANQENGDAQKVCVLHSSPRVTIFWLLI